MDMTPPSKYISAVDLDGREHTLVMADIRLEEMNKGEERKNILYFEKAEKGLVLNKTNTLAIIAGYGKYSENWIGQKVILFPTKVPFQGQIKDAVRVRIPLKPNEKVTTGSAKPVTARPQSSEITEEMPPNKFRDIDDEIPF